VKLRARDWTNTVNFHNVAKDDLPINDYGDRTRFGKQTKSWAHRFNSSAVEWQTPTLSHGSSDTVRDFALNEYIRLDASVGPSLSACNNEAAVKLLGKIAETKVNLGVMFAEAKKTSDFILGRARSVDKAFRAFKRGRFREVADVLGLSRKTVHKTWLEYKYAVTPLLIDAKNAAEFFAQQHCGRPVRFMVKSSARYAKNDSRLVTFPYGSGTGKYTIGANLTYTVKIKAWCEISNPHLSALQQLGLTNPVLIAWELVPFSFVFDWFISVGSWLEGLTATHGVNVLKAMKSFIAEGFAIADMKGQVIPDGSGWYVMDPWVKEGTIREYWRDQFSIDPLSTYPPVGTKAFGFDRLVTSLALLRAQRR
jgi:hypothetical protein